MRKPPQLHNFDTLARSGPRRNRVLRWRQQMPPLAPPWRFLLFPWAAAPAARPDAIGSVQRREVKDLGLNLVDDDAIVVGEVAEGGSGGNVASQD